MSGGRAFVLGASSGLGAHLARRLAEEGWEVLGTGRRTEADLPGAVRYLRADLEVDADRAEVAAQLHDTSPDLIVHSAVTYGERSGSARSLEAIDAMFRVNASAPFVLLRDHLAALPADRACSCVVVNSDSIFHANQTSAEYAATKAALRVLTAGLASACRGRRSSVATLALGPLADPRKLGEMRAIAERRQMPVEDVVQTYLTRSNPSLVITELIDLDACLRSVLHIAGLGPTANGMVLRLDGGSSGSLV